MSAAPLRFYYDVVCPYAYLASLQIDGFARRFGLEVERRPVLLGGLLRAFGAPDDPNRAMSPARTRHTHADIRRQGALHGRTLAVPESHPRRTLDAMRLVIAAPSERRTAVAASLFAAYWEQGRDVAAREVLATIAAAHGLDVAAIDAPEVKAELRARTDEAAAAGVFGVPTFAHGELRVWGQDRLGILEDGLRRGGRIPEGPPPTPRWIRSDPPPSVRFFHDFASPFSYLASTQIERVCAAAGATLEVVPILLGALFRSIGTADVPLFTMHPAKQAWVRRDLDDWAAHWGVALAFPSRFPIRSVLPLRVALLEPAATAAIYRAAWVDDLPVAEPEVLAGVLDRAGLPAADLIAQAEGDAAKAALRRNTEDAEAAGICGVPSFVVRRAGRPDAVLWGQDRLDLLAATLAGFDLPA